jgi:hypothetical protein
MNRDDILRMAKEAGLALASFCRWSAYSDDLERFATLVAAEKEQQMIRDGWRQCAKGQRTTQYCGLLDAAVKDEREACAKVCEGLRPSKPEYDQRFNDGCTLSAAAIRARGEA